jgi:hypothetical protein
MSCVNASNIENGGGVSTAGNLQSQSPASQGEEVRLLRRDEDALHPSLHGGGTATDGVNYCGEENYKRSSEDGLTDYTHLYIRNHKLETPRALHGYALTVLPAAAGAAALLSRQSQRSGMHVTQSQQRPLASIAARNSPLVTWPSPLASAHRGLSSYHQHSCETYGVQCGSGYMAAHQRCAWALANWPAETRS